MYLIMIIDTIFMYVKVVPVVQTWLGGFGLVDSPSETVMASPGSSNKKMPWRKITDVSYAYLS